MVQASDMDVIENEEKDVPQALLLLNEMNNSAQHVAQLVDNMILQVKKGELSTSQGLSFLEMKYHMLLSYLINVTYVVLRKCSGEKIEDDPSIDRLIEIRAVLEKIKPIDNKLKYQIDKLVKCAVTGENDPSAFRANPDNLISKLDDASDSDEVSQEKESKPDKYVPPKLAAVYYTGDESAAERNKRMQEKSKKHVLHSSILQDLKEEYLDTPAEISHSNHAQYIISRREQEKQEYEENYLTRLPVTKADKIRQKKLTTIGSLGDELTKFGSKTFGSSSSKRKRKVVKSKSNKKRRYN